MSRLATVSARSSERFLNRLAFPRTLSFLIVFASSFAFAFGLSFALVVSFPLALRDFLVNEIYVHRVMFSL